MRVFVLAAAMLLFLAIPRVANSEGPSWCPPGTFPRLDTWQCVGFVDVSTEHGYEIPVPDLRELRGQEGLLGPGLPPPPSTGAFGTFYKDGELQAPEGATFFTYVTVYPGGIPGIGNWYFLTAMNRTDFGVEVVIIYAGDANGTFGVFDWSCTDEVVQVEPCQNQTNPWQITESLRDYEACYYRMSRNFGGDWHFMMGYQNVTEKLDSGSPPLWRNRVLLFNSCTGVYDQVYSHQYRAYPLDCSLGLCAGWAGIHEVFWENHPWPPVPHGGFWFQGLMIHGPGGFLGFLTPDVTNFIPPPPEWELRSFIPNHTYTAGSFLDSDADGVGDEADADDDDDGWTDVDEAGARLCIGTKNDDAGFDANDDRANDGCPAFGLGESDCSGSMDDDNDGYANDGCPRYGAYSEAQFNIGTNPLGTCRSGGTSPNPNWPTDLWAVGASADRVDISDLTSFLAPVRRVNSSPGSPSFDMRWDLVPGSGSFGDFISIVDLQELVVVSPPMFGGRRAYYGPPCR